MSTAQAYRNSVPVPRHWSQKRKYLQGKRGLEKPPFKLPEFIEATGIGEMRQAYQEKVGRPVPAQHMLFRCASPLLEAPTVCLRWSCKALQSRLRTASNAAAAALQLVAWAPCHEGPEWQTRASFFNAAWAQEENKKLRQKQKDKVQPKMGKLDIDYQARHRRHP